MDKPTEKRVLVEFDPATRNGIKIWTRSRSAMGWLENNMAEFGGVETNAYQPMSVYILRTYDRMQVILWIEQEINKLVDVPAWNTWRQGDQVRLMEGGKEAATIISVGANGYIMVSINERPSVYGNTYNQFEFLARRGEFSIGDRVTTPNVKNLLGLVGVVTEVNHLSVYIEWYAGLKPIPSPRQDVVRL